MLGLEQTYSRADGPERDHPLDAVRVAAHVGLETRIVTLLQDELLSAEAGVLIANPATEIQRDTCQTLVFSLSTNSPTLSKRFRVLRYLRSTLDLQGADVLHATLHDVLAAGGELHTLSLEPLLVVHGDLHTQTYGTVIHVSCRCNSLSQCQGKPYPAYTCVSAGKIFFVSVRVFAG